MRTNSEIKQMFKEIGLDTEEKRSRFNFSYSYQPDKAPDVTRFVRADTKTEELKEEKNAELE